MALEDNGAQFLSNKAILITGATGFLVLVEKILRVQPKVKKLYLLIRVKETSSALDTLQNEVFQRDLFRMLIERENEKFDSLVSEKVVPIAGDTSLPDLGIDRSVLSNEIDAIIHVAATTRFQDRYDVAFAINTMGAMNVINFANMCSQLQVLIHVSTAYVCGKKKGLIAEKPCKMGDTLSGRLLDIDVEKRLIDETFHNLEIKTASPKEIRRAMISLGKQRAKYYGWQNTYVLTKAMGEMIIWQHKKDLPVVIVRPTMICSTYKDPFPGWVEGFGSASLATIFYGKGFTKFMHADGESIFDLIPADMVVNCIITSMMTNSKKPGLTIYQVCSSSRNPITFKKFIDFNFQYFEKFPWVDDKGLVVKMKTGKLFKSRAIFLLHIAKKLPMLMVLKLLKIGPGCCLNMGQEKLEMQLKVTYKIAELFAPFVCFAGIFDDKNTEKLRTWMSEAGIDAESFNFDPRRIDWQDYLLNVHIPATVKYLF